MYVDTSFSISECTVFTLCHLKVSSYLSMHDSCFKMAIFSDLRVPNMGPLWDPNFGQGPY
jgi:hypothetical protein